ncbi:MAG: hypothetical protein K9K79_10820 [Desulfohalobiaceae bacterium]|nr:hypothetical protein [Desulfohalobiaceae bacterium]
MINILNFLESIYSAAAFAEANQSGSALTCINRGLKKKLKEKSPGRPKD